jgi:hypothetical protein
VAAFHFPHFLARLRAVAGDDTAERLAGAIAARDLEAAAAALDENLVREFVLVTTPRGFPDAVAAFDEASTVIPMPVGIFALGLPGLPGAGVESFLTGRAQLLEAMLGVPA